MALLIDLSSIRGGGGLQLALNFISLLNKEEFSERKLFILASAEVGPLTSSQFTVIGVVPNSAWRRFLFEYIKLPALLKKHEITAIYSFFGAGLPIVGGRRSVVNVAYPIICYPDSPYWSRVPAFQKAKKIIWNLVRVRRIAGATVIVCETPVMGRRIQKRVGPIMPPLVIPPAASEFINDTPVSDALERIRKSPTLLTRVLVLSGLAFHKNVWRLYEVALCLRARNISVRFVCSFSREDFIDHVKHCARLNNIDYSALGFFEFRGPVSPEKIGEMYSDCGSLINISDLESFSNNYMEAWRASVLLICSDRDFSREICRETALYCEPHDPQSVADAIARMVGSSDDEFALRLRRGKELLAKLPTQSQRASAILRLLAGS